MKIVKLSERTNCTDCKFKLITNENFIEHDEYLKLLSRGGLTLPCPFFTWFYLPNIQCVRLYFTYSHEKIKHKKHIHAKC